LIEFYLACIDAEDRRSLRLPLGARGRSFISPWTDREPLLHPAAEQVEFTAADELEFEFLSSVEAQAGGVERFFYGYPVRLTSDDYLAPLFLLEVEIERQADRFRLRPVDPRALIPNRYLLDLHHLGIEEQQHVEDMLEEDYGSFAARLSAVFDYLGQDLGALAGDRIEPLPAAGTRTERWVSCPILFRSARSTFTQGLRRELQAFLRYPRLLEQADQTALGASVGRPPPGQPAAVALLEVVPLNEEQRAAANAALGQPLTVITGPPGTGKSQVVIDLLASCAAAGRPVLFCSKNNKAVDVVRERLRELLGSEDDWTLRLGSRHHMEAARQEMTQRIDTCRAPESVPPRSELAAWDRQAARAAEQRAELEDLRGRLAQADENLRWAAERLPDSWIDQTPSDWPHRLARARLGTLRDRAAGLSGQGRLSWWLRVLRRLVPGLLRKRLRAALEEFCALLPPPIGADTRETADRNPSFRPLAEAFARLLAYARWLEARDRASELESELARLPSAARLAEEIRQARQAKAAAGAAWLRAWWTAEIAANRARVRDLLARYFAQNEALYEAGGREFARRLDALSATIAELARHMPVWIVTNLSARRSLPLKPALFDLVVVDEASQCDVASALPLLFRARRAVIIGDPHQLRHITILRDSEEQELARRTGVEALLDDWSYVHRSLYDLAARQYRQAGHEPIFLREHFRSWPLIVEFSNRCVYRSRLRPRTDLQSLQRRLNGAALGVLWHQVRGQVSPTQRSASNRTEAEAIVELLRGWWNSGFLARTDLRFGIVTPFRPQVELLGHLLRRQPWWEALTGRLLLGTAHQFQGDECDVMVFSPVVAGGMRPVTRQWLTRTEHLLNVAITRARGVLHVVGDRAACEAAGGLLAEFAAYVAQVAPSSAQAGFSPAEARMAELLGQTGLWYHPQYPLGRDRLDFLVISPFGTRYDLEVDGRHHRTPEQIQADRVRDRRVESAGYVVLRLAARAVLGNEQWVRARVARLV